MLKKPKYAGAGWVCNETSHIQWRRKEIASVEAVSCRTKCVANFS